MKALTPGNGLMTLRKEMDRLFDRLWDRDWLELPQLSEGWFPPIDLVETDQSIVVAMDVPGMDVKDIHVTVSTPLCTPALTLVASTAIGSGM